MGATGRGRKTGPPAWITPNGIDPRKLPLEQIARQALAEDEGQFRSACTLLGTMASWGRHDAGIFLLGLLLFHRADLQRLAEVVRALTAFRTSETADALVGELRRVKSEPATRRYLNDVLTALMRLPKELVGDRLVELAEDRSFSAKWRRKLEDAARVAHDFDDNPRW